MVKGLVIHYYPPKGLAEPLDKCLADSSTRTKSNRVMQNATEMISQLIHNPPSEKQHLSVFDWQAHNLIRTSKAASQDDTCNKMIFKKVCSNRKKTTILWFLKSPCGFSHGQSSFLPLGGKFWHALEGSRMEVGCFLIHILFTCLNSRFTFIISQTLPLQRHK